MMNTKLIGAHMPISGGLDDAIRKGKAMGCTAIQIFTANPRQWKGKSITSEAKENFLAAREETGIQSIISHDTYLVNLCAPNAETHEKSKKALMEELHRCSYLKIPYAVSHMGSHLGQGEEVGIKRIVETTLEVLAETPEDTSICMETTAGQGSALNYKFEQLASIIEACKGHRRLAICLDTCHIFVAGYDISSPEGYEKTFKDFERLIGLDRLKVIHCNDSKKPCNSKVDRHEHISKGYVGEKSFQLLVNDLRFKNIPIILETPESETMHLENLNALKSYINN